MAKYGKKNLFDKLVGILLDLLVYVLTKLANFFEWLHINVTSKLK